VQRKKTFESSQNSNLFGCELPFCLITGSSVVKSLIKFTFLQAYKSGFGHAGVKAGFFMDIICNFF
jgi:hypothetical protein